MPKGYFHCRCDFGHHWTLFGDVDRELEAGQLLCPQSRHPAPPGSRLPDDAPEFREAVTVLCQPMLDFVEVAVRPAARIVDQVKDLVGHDYEFHLVIRDLHRGTERLSQRTFTWLEAMKELEGFRNCSPGRAWQRLDSLDSGL